MSFENLKDVGINSYFSENDSITLFFTQNFRNIDPIKYWPLNQICEIEKPIYETNIETFTLIKMQSMFGCSYM